MSECYVETSGRFAIVHKHSEVSPRIITASNFELTMEQATSLVESNDGYSGPIWCGECYPDKSPAY